MGIPKMKREAEIREELIYLKTSKQEDLVVTKDDLINSAAKDVVIGSSVLFVGEAGNGKTARGDALCYSENYQKIFLGSPLEKIQIQPVFLHVDMIPLVAALELHYENRIDNGTSQRVPVQLSQFILEHGHKEREGFEEEERRRLEVIKSRNGVMRPKILIVDDFDRCIEIGVTNAFMKSICSNHLMLFNGEERWMRLQAIATSNSSCGRPRSGYIASRGIDVAIGNRFQIYYIGKANTLRILSSEFPALNGFVEKITSLSDEIKYEMGQGSFSAIGELSLRQIRKCVELVAYLGESEKDAATRLLAGIGQEDEERTKADMLIDKYFGATRGKVRRFAF